MTLARSLRFRLVAAAAFWVLLALVLTGTVVSELLRGQFKQLLEARLDTEMLGLMAGAEFEDNGALVLQREPPEPAFTRIGSGWYWQIDDGEGVLLSSRSLTDRSLPPPPLVQPTGPSTHLASDPDGLPLLIRSRQFSAPGDPRLLLVQVAMPMELLTREVDRIRRPLLIALLVLGGSLLMAVGVQIGFGLRPLAQLRRQLLAVRAGECTHIGSAPVSELEPLTDEINALIAHAEGTLQHARAHVGNLAHGLKTPLTAVLNGIRASGDPKVQALETELLRMQQLVELHLRRARHAGPAAPLSAGTLVAPLVREFVSLMERVHADRALAVQQEVPADLRFAGEAGDLQELVGNLLDNAWKWATSMVRIRGGTTSDGITLSIEDDGPGMNSAVLERARLRGVRLDETVPGHGLGLAIVSDLCQLHGGALELARSELGGLCATLRLPRLHNPPARNL